MMTDWIRTLEEVITEQQKMFLKNQSLNKNSISYYMLSLPSKEISSMCIIHMMRVLMSNSIRTNLEDAARASQLIDPKEDFMASDIKITAIELF